MHSEMRAQAAFRLTGLRSEGASRPSDLRDLRPALAAGFRDLAAMRYDFPVVLPAPPAGDEAAIPLTALVDRLLEKLATPDARGEGIRKAVLRLEREVRRLLAQGEAGSLHQLWDRAAQRLAGNDESLTAILGSARRALPFDGALRDCDASFPGDLLARAWNAVQRRKANRFHDEVQRLIVGLGEILDADEARSAQGRSPERLRETMGTAYRDAFDFESMSRLLGRSSGKRPLSDSRRRRIRSLLVALESQRFFLDESGFTFTFDRCGLALRTFRARYARLRSLARSMAMARLELEGRYDESRHDALFRQMRQSPLNAEELARFPDYLVCLREGDLDPVTRAELLELLCSGIPAKILVQSDDLLEEAAFAEGLAAVGARADALCGVALGLNDVYVLQTSASNLPRMGEQVMSALEYPGPALFSVFSGATGDSASLPPYLNAAAATESRAFPTLTYDPARPLDAGSRFSLAGNPQPECDWPVHAFDYEDADHQRAHRDLHFTIADFVATDERFARHFLAVPSGQLVPVADWLDADAPSDFEPSPVIAMVDQDDRLRDVVVDEAVLDLALRARDRWRRLQRLAAMGMPLAKEALAVVTPPPEEAAAAVPAAAPAPVAVPAEAPPKASADEAYIETPRCTSCDECTKLNNRMFAYDGNKQAYIADVKAGTYRELVEAAESCQVSIIHPGKPRNPDEAGLEELIERASPFQ